jgi:predicted amidohydrolase
MNVNPVTGLIASMYKLDEEIFDKRCGKVIDLREKIVLPGLVDIHTHIFLHTYSKTLTLNQICDESDVEQILCASNHAKAALLVGYTTYPDLGTEGLYYADIWLRGLCCRNLDVDFVLHDFGRVVVLSEIVIVHIPEINRPLQVVR